MHGENARARGKRLAFIQKLAVAEKLSGHPAIYFPHTLDFRGRVYPIPRGGPHPQGDDAGRSLLTFAQGLPLGDSGARWLAVHLANLFGVDKVGFDERVRWVKDNEARILDSALNPLDGHRFWTTADKPWQALAACFEWAGYVKDGEGFVSHLPIALDGSNSGLQHFTALLRDPEAAPYVNLVESDRPGDLYAHVAALAQADADHSPSEQAKAWQGGRITRKIVKRPCMTYAYSATTFGMAEQIEEVLKELDALEAEAGRPPYLKDADRLRSATWLAGILYRIVSEQVPAAAETMTWLKKTAQLISKAGLPIWWDTPVGLPVLQSYTKAASKQIEVTFRGQRLQLGIEEQDSTDLAAFIEHGGRPINSRRVLAAIAPNFIHSLDAAHLMMVANRCHEDGIDALAVIHDSFGTHAANTDKLAAILRQTFVELYRGDPLAAYRKTIVAQLDHEPAIQAEVPPLPAYGDFDLEAVSTTTYMFS